MMTVAAEPMRRTAKTPMESRQPEGNEEKNEPVLM